MGQSRYSSRFNTTRRDRSLSTSTTSGASDRSRSTAPTVYSQHPVVKVLDNGWCEYGNDDRESTYTYASTVPSLEDLLRTEHVEQVSARYEDFPSDAVASTPPSFGRLFPSTRKLLVKHDDTTIDGNMNLRVVTRVHEASGNEREIILFHLRMHDLHDRKFSLRRYCRDSGREVCHSKRKYHQPVGEKVTSAFSTLRSRQEPGRNSATSAKRESSSHGPRTRNNSLSEKKLSRDVVTDAKDTVVPTQTIQLEFSNYAHVDVKRRGTKGSKHYDFEYWSTRYQWRRRVHKDGNVKEISYHLFPSGGSKPVAHILPEHLSPLETLEEESKGGWVPPSTMWINDPSLFKTMNEVADVVVATGLLSLVDDSIRRRWHRSSTSRLTVPVTSSFMKGVESVSPGKIIDKVFHRCGSSASRNSASLRQLFAHG